MTLFKEVHLYSLREFSQSGHTYKASFMLEALHRTACVLPQSDLRDSGFGEIHLLGDWNCLICDGESLSVVFLLYR
jgi:hypothetical protein